MEEFVPKRKTKIFTKEFVAKYSYVLVLAVLLIGGISYGYTFFTENKKIASGSITTANLTINFSNREINASNLSVPSNDQEGLSEFSKSLTITNQTTIDGKVKLNITRTSGLNLTDMRYALIVNGAIQEIADVPSNGEILTNAIMGNETINVEVRLWPKTTYSGNTTTFVGEITLEISYLGATATDTSNLTGKYVNFNCISTCEVWQIVKVEDDRLVLTRQADYSGATSRTNSNKYNSSLTFNDNSLITSVSTDNKNVYLAKTVKINGGSGTQADPYNLVNNEFREGDKKVIAVIAYKYETTTVGTQRIYYNETNYISQVYDDPDFSGWTDGTNNYELGDVINISSDTVLTAVLVPKLSNRIMTLCNDSNITYVKKYNTANGAPIDTPDGSGNEDVCYYTSTSANDLNADQNGNVIFGDYCWQIVRTTADGGVKLIYNGLKTNDNKCPDDSSSRPGNTYVKGGFSSNANLSGSKIYGDSYETFVDNGTNKFRLKNTETNSWSNSTYKDIVGKYVCGTSSSPTGTSDTCQYMYYVNHYISYNKAGVTTYNIEALNSIYSIVGAGPYSGYPDHPDGVGYMYNDTYIYEPFDYDLLRDFITFITYRSSPGSYYYGDKATWNSNTGEYELTVDDGDGHDITPTTTYNWSDIRSNVKGLYTCGNSRTSCSTVLYVTENSSNTIMRYFELSNAENINTKGLTLNYSTSYDIINGNYVLDNPTTITILYKDWPDIYTTSTYKNMYTCSDFTSSTCSELYYFGSTSQYTISYNKSSKNYIFGNNVTYENGSYTINNDSDPTKYQQVWDWYKSYNTVNNSHYTCLKTDTNVCGDKVYFLVSTSANTGNYITMKNGDTVEIVLEKMFNNSNSTTSTLNKYNSGIKGVVDNWYAANLTSLSQYLDNNAVFCNNRLVSNFGSWSRTGNTSTKTITFAKYSTNSTNYSLSCPLITDRFSKNNTDIAELKYPIGILSYDEVLLMNQYVTRRGSLWTMTPYLFDEVNSSARVYNISSDGSMNGDRDSIHSPNYIRPVIVLKPGITITGGNGTYDTPYIIDINS